jgi:hypothetical protein
MENTSDFILRLSQNKELLRDVTNIEKRGNLNIITGLFSLFFGIFILIENALKPSIKDLKEIEKNINSFRFFNALNSIFTAFISIYTGYNLIYKYVPSGSEISLAILIKYLKKTNILDQKIYDILSKLKPYQIGKLNI